MDITNSILWLILGIASGCYWAQFRSRKLAETILEDHAQSQGQLREKYGSELSKSAGFFALAEERRNRISELEEEIINLRSSFAKLQKESVSIEEKKTALEELKKQHDKEIDEFRQKMLLEFENLAGKILGEKTKNFDENSKTALISLIDPLKANIKDFQTNIDKKYEDDLKDRTALKQEIRFITQAGKELKDSSEGLAKALRGDSRAQGKWGELVLERILESSGLKKGREFSVQESYSSEEAGRQRPDVTVYLPDQKIIFIDSKVSLTHYSEYIAVEDDFDKSAALVALENAFCTHIKELSQKKYQSIDDITTLDFVLMFTPIESAFSLITQNYEEGEGQSLFEFAWERGVIITSPTTLMPILKTINICWKAEYQNKNSKKIAEEAIKLYDKFVVFVTKLEKIGSSIKKLQEYFEGTMNTLQDGTGSLMKRCDHIRKLVKKERKVSEQYFEEDEIFDSTDDEIELAIFEDKTT